MRKAFIILILSLITFELISQELPFFFHTTEFRSFVTTKKVTTVQDIFQRKYYINPRYVNIWNKEMTEVDKTILLWDSITYLDQNIKTYFLDKDGYINKMYPTSTTISLNCKKQFTDSSMFKKLLNQEYRIDTEFKRILEEKHPTYSFRGYFDAINSRNDSLSYAVDSSGIMFFHDERHENDMVIDYYFRIWQVLDFKKNNLVGYHSLVYRGDFWIPEYSNYEFVTISDSLQMLRWKYRFLIDVYPGNYRIQDTSYLSYFYKIHTIKSSNIESILADKQCLSNIHLDYLRKMNVHEVDKNNIEVIFEGIKCGLLHQDRTDMLVLVNTYSLSFSVDTDKMKTDYSFLSFPDNRFDLNEFTFGHDEDFFSFPEHIPYKHGYTYYGYDSTYTPQENELILLKSILKTDRGGKVKSKKYYSLDSDGNWNLWATEFYNQFGKIIQLKVDSRFKWCRNLTTSFKESLFYDNLSFVYYLDKGKYTFIYDQENILKSISNEKNEPILLFEKDKITFEKKEYPISYEESNGVYKFREKKD